MLVATLPGIGSHTTRRWYSQYQTLVLTVPDVGTPSGTASVGTGLLYYKLGWLTEVSLFYQELRWVLLTELSHPHKGSKVFVYQELES